MSIVYISAPYGADDPAKVAWNVERAALLCLLAARSGCAPICVHPGILAGAYGDDGCVEDRERGLRIDCRLLDPCDAVWALELDDGSMSSGMVVEHQHWGDGDAKALPWERRTWANWMPMFEEHGLRERAQALAQWRDGGALTGRRRKLRTRFPPGLLTEEQAHAVYDALMDLGASAGSRMDCVRQLTTTERGEYRFGGVLGSGGKVYWGMGGVRVSAYEETIRKRDLGPLIAKVNGALKAFLGELD